MTVSDFCTRYGVLGQLSTKSGPRLYIQRARHVGHVTHTPRMAQTAYLDLTTYTAHVITHGAGMTVRQCRQASEQLERKLEPLARLARMCRVTHNGQAPSYTQQREIFRALHRVGVQSVCGIRCIELTSDRVFRATSVPLLHARETFVVHLEPLQENATWSKPFATLGQLHQAIGDDLLHQVRVVVSTYGEAEQSDVDAIHRAAVELLAEVFHPITVEP